MTLILFAPASTKWFKDVKTENPKGTVQVDFVTFIVQSCFDQYSFGSRVISDIFCGAGFESNGPKDTR